MTPRMHNYGFIDVEQVNVTALSGTHIDDAISNALILALEEKRKVVLTHNEGRVVIDPFSVIRWVANKGCEKK